MNAAAHAAVVDAHHHVWDLPVRAQPWLDQDGLDALRRNFTLADLEPGGGGGRRHVGGRGADRRRAGGDPNLPGWADRGPGAHRGVSAAEQDAVFAATARRVYRVDRPGTA